MVIYIYIRCGSLSLLGRRGSPLSECLFGLESPRSRGLPPPWSLRRLGVPRPKNHTHARSVVHPTGESGVPPPNPSANAGGLGGGSPPTRGLWGELPGFSSDPVSDRGHLVGPRRKAHGGLWGISQTSRWLPTISKQKSHIRFPHELEGTLDPLKKWKTRTYCPCYFCRPRMCGPATLHPPATDHGGSQGTPGNPGVSEAPS